MFILVMLVGLIFLVSGGVGLFYAFANIAGGTELWVVSIIVFSTFAVLGLAVLVFLALFNTEFD